MRSFTTQTDVQHYVREAIASAISYWSAGELVVDESSFWDVAAEHEVG